MQDEARWTPAEIREQFRLASPLIRRFQLELARTPGRELSAEELAEALGTARSGLAGGVGSYSGTVYRRWGHRVWPFSVRRDYRGNRTLYCMPADVARIVETLVDE